jgi:hypothetical protein
MYNSSDAIIYAAINDLISTYGVNDKNLSFLLNSKEINTPYMINKFLSKYPIVKGVDQKYVNDSLKLMFSKVAQSGYKVKKAIQNPFIESVAAPTQLPPISVAPIPPRATAPPILPPRPAAPIPPRATAPPQLPPRPAAPIPPKVTAPPILPPRPAAPIPPKVTAPPPLPPRPAPPMPPKATAPPPLPPRPVPPLPPKVTAPPTPPKPPLPPKYK